MSPLLAALVCIMKDMQSNVSPTDAYEVLERKRDCKRLLSRLPDVARSMSPLLAALVCIMKDMQSNVSPTDAYEVLERKRDCKRLLSRVYKQSLNLESQLHQYINPGLVTSLQKRTMRATGQIDVIVKLIKKLRKESRKACYDLESRRKTCEISVQLKSLLAQQKCEWQCVGRLKETLTMAKEIMSLLKFICKLTSLIEKNGDALRRIYEGPPPYEYRSPYDDLHNIGSSYGTGDNVGSSDVTPNITQRCRTSSPPVQSQSEVTISLSFDYLRNSDKLSTNRSKHEMTSPRSRKCKLDVGSGASGGECGRENVHVRHSMSRQPAREKNHRTRGIKLYSINPRSSHRSLLRNHPTKNKRKRKDSDDREENKKRKVKKQVKNSKKTGSGHRSQASDKSVLCSKSCCIQCDSLPVSSRSRNADKTGLKKTRKRIACQLSDVESSRSDAQGRRSRSDLQCHQSHSDSQGHRSRSDSQGHKSRSNAQGHKSRSSAQEHKSRSNAQGHKSRSNEQCQRSKDKKKHKKKKIKYKIKPDKCKCCKRVNLALDRCAHKKMSASVPASSVSKFYLHPVTSINSFGSRQPLLFSSCDSNFGNDFSESHNAEYGGKHNKTHWHSKSKKSLEQFDDRKDSSSTSSTNSCELDCTTASAEISWIDNTSVDCSGPCNKLNETCDDKRQRGGDKPILHRSSASLPSSKRTYCPKLQQSLRDCLSSTSQPELQSFSQAAKSSQGSNEVQSISSSIRVSGSLCNPLDSDSVTDSCFDCKDELQPSATDLQTETLSEEMSISISVSSKRSFVTANVTATREKSSVSCTSSYSDRLLFSDDRDDQLCAKPGLESSRKSSAGHHTEKPGRRHSSPNKEKMAKMSLSRLSVEFCSPKSHKQKTCFSPKKLSKHQQVPEEAYCTEKSDVLMPTRRSWSNKEASVERPSKHLYLHGECSTGKQSVLNSERLSRQYFHEEYLPDRRNVISPDEFPDGNRAAILSQRSSRQSTILWDERSPRKQSIILSNRPSVLIEDSPKKQYIVSESSPIQSCLHSGELSVIVSPRVSRQSYVLEEGQSVLDELTLDEKFVTSSPISIRKSVVPEEYITERQIISYVPEECITERQPLLLSKKPSRQSGVPEECITERKIASCVPDECITERQQVLLCKRPSRQSYAYEECITERPIVSNVPDDCIAERQQVLLCKRPSIQSYVPEECMTERPVVSNVPDDCIAERQQVLLCKRLSRQSYVPEECITERPIVSYVPDECITERQPVLLSERPSRQLRVPEECINERPIVSYVPNECITERQTDLLYERPSIQSYVNERCIAGRQRDSYVSEECVIERQPALLSEIPSRQSRVPEECITEKPIVSYVSEECITEKQHILLCDRPSRQSYVVEEKTILSQRPSVQLYAQEECLPYKDFVILSHKSSQRISPVMSQKSSKQSNLAEERSPEKQSPALSHKSSRQSTEEINQVEEYIISPQKSPRQSYVYEETSPQTKSPILSQRSSKQLHVPEEISQVEQNIIPSQKSSRQTYLPEESFPQQQSRHSHVSEISPLEQVAFLSQKSSRQSIVTDESSPKRQASLRQSYTPEQLSSAEQPIILSRKSSRQSYLPEESSPQRQSPNLSKRPSKQMYVPEEPSPRIQTPNVSKRPSKQMYVPEEPSPRIQTPNLSKRPSKHMYVPEEPSPRIQSPNVSKRPSKQMYVPEEPSPRIQTPNLSKRPSKQMYVPEEPSPQIQTPNLSKRPSKQMYVPEEPSPQIQTPNLSKRPSKQMYVPEEPSPQIQSHNSSKRPSRQSYTPNVPDESYSDKKRASVISSVSIESVLIGSPYLNKTSENPLTSSSQIITDSQYSFPAHHSPTKSSRKPSENQNASPSSTSLVSKKSKKSLPRPSLTIPSLDFISADTNMIYPQRRSVAAPRSPQNTSPNKTSSKQSILDFNERRLSQDERRLSQDERRLSQDERELSHAEDEPDDDNETSLESSDNIPESPKATEPVHETPPANVSQSPRRTPSSPRKKTLREELQSPSPIRHQTFQEKLSAASRKSLGISSQPTSKRKLQEKAFVDNEPTTTSESLPAEKNSQKRGYSKYWWLLLLLLFIWCCFIYLLICYFTKPACSRCTLPLPNIIFYPLNKVVNSARLVHFGPTPS